MATQIVKRWQIVSAPLSQPALTSVVSVPTPPDPPPSPARSTSGQLLFCEWDTVTD